MSIRLEYIVCNKKGDELNRFDIKSEAEAYDSVICAAEDISMLLEPLKKKLALNEDQIYAISEHLAFQSDEVKLALKQIKKVKVASPIEEKIEEKAEEETETKDSDNKTASKKAPRKK
ncbi:YebG family protein [sulfur-oxidizing endosymbiont of Gigantopelta aegis]|uniref:YebG family protein n=1 Tax=sulfur-oxidizing endosymbiont of Gigantopelta aegis TaxID=2794934 RepID=UPI0018DC539B|nr:YebG family protein [sulfur-oxidizing endosymbiont of Gigantopelta aegis]